MSGPSDLARLTVTIDTANELFLSEVPKMIDVGGGVMRPTNAKVLADLATQMFGAMIYTSTALGLAGTVSGSHFTVLSAASDEYLKLYRNDSGVATYIDTIPNAQALNTITAIIKPFLSASTEVDYLSVTDDLGAVLARFTSKAIRTVALDIAATLDKVTTIGTSEGSLTLYADDERLLLGPMEMRPTTLPGAYVTDTFGNILTDLNDPKADPIESSPFKDGVLFSPLIVTFGSESVKLYPQNMLPRRDRSEAMVATISSTSTDAVSTGRAIDISAGQFGSGAVLQLRSKADATIHRFLNLTLRNVPTQSTPVPVKVLMIGDSIGNRYGGVLLEQYLVAHGYAPTFIGTFPGSGNPTNSNDDTGKMGECREGWETGDFTNAVIDRVTAVAAGGESGYLALSKAQKANINPFLRAAGGGDSASIIRNGNVFDPAYYVSRFSLPTPDVVVIMVGTNDSRDRAANTVYNDVYANDTIMISQIRAAWPACRIIRCLPGTAISEERNRLWTSHYLPMIRAIQDVQRVRADSKSYLAPTWAMSDPESGYFMPIGTVDQNGIMSGDWQDPIHPIASSRAALYKALAAYVAWAAITLT